MQESSIYARDVLTLGAMLADLKEAHYQLLLSQSALAELMTDKHLFTIEELQTKMTELDAAWERNAKPVHHTEHITGARHPKG
jgi:hypothetical protein